MTDSGNHVTDGEIGRIVDGRTEAKDLRRLVRHLVECRECRERKRPFLGSLNAVQAVLEGGEDRPLPEAAYEEAVERALGAAGSQCKCWEEEAMWRERLIAAGHRRRFRIETSDVGELFAGVKVEASPGMAYVEALLALSFEERYRDTQEMQDLAQAAVLAAKSLGWRRKDKGRYTPMQAADLQARAMAELANAFRLNHELEQAELTIVDAVEHLQEEGSGDLAIRARLFDVYASLRLDQRQLGEAFAALAEVCRLYEELGERHLVGRALISMGIAAAYDERPREAAGLLREGLERIDPGRDPKLVVNARYELLGTLVVSERFQEASAFHLQSGLRQAFADDPLNLLKLRWLEGKIFFGLGKLARAEAVFREVQAEFRQRDRTYLAAMLNLELAAVSLRQGKSEEAAAQATSALRTFEFLCVPFEALRAVSYLRDACRQRRASAALALRVVYFLDRLEREPALRFVP